MKKSSRVYLIGILCFFGIGLASGYLWGRSEAIPAKDYELTQNRRAPHLSKTKILTIPSEYRDSDGNITDFGKIVYAKKEEWRKMSPAELREEYHTLNNSEQFKKYGIWYVLFREWANLHPADALDFAIELREKGGKNSKMEVLMSSVAENDPKLVLDCIMKNKESCYDFEILKEVFSQLAKKDDAQAWKELTSLSLLEQDALLVSFIDGLRKNNPEKLSQYLSQINWATVASDERFSHLEKMTLDKAIAKSDININELDRHLEYRKEKIQFQRLSNLGLDDFPAFEQQFSALPQGEKENFFQYWKQDSSRILCNAAPERLLALFERETQSGVDMSTAVENLFGNWPNWDTEGMLQSINNLKDEKNKKAAKVAFARTCPYLDHAKNIELINNLQLTDKIKEQELLSNAYKKWHAESPEKAEASMNQSVLSENSKLNIKNGIHSPIHRDFYVNSPYYND